MYYRFTMDYGNSVATSAVVVSRDTTHCRGVYKWLSTICFTIIRAWALTKSFFFQAQNRWMQPERPQALQMNSWKLNDRLGPEPSSAAAAERTKCRISLIGECPFGDLVRSSGRVENSANEYSNDLHCAGTLFFFFVFSCFFFFLGDYYVRPARRH